MDGKIAKKLVEIYRDSIFPKIKAYEVARKRIHKKEIIKGIGYLFIALVSFCIFNISTRFSLSSIIAMISLTSFWFFLLAAIFRPFACLWSKNHKTFMLDLKKSSIPKILSIYENVFYANNREVIKKHDLYSSDLFPCCSERIIDDVFWGTYKDLSFAVSEMKLIRGIGKNRMQVFSGLVFLFDINKNESSKTVLSTKGDLTKKSEVWLAPAMFLVAFLQSLPKAIAKGDFVFTGVVLAIAIILGVIIPFIFSKFESENVEQTQKVELEDPEFNKKYNVVATDQIKARYYITPAFMEKFKNLQTVYKSKKAKCAFYEDKIMFALDTNKNLFEMGHINKTLENPEYFKNVCEEITAIFDLIDYFKIDSKY